MINRVTKIGVYNSIGVCFPKVVYLSIFGECLQVKHSEVYGLNCFSLGLRKSLTAPETISLFPHYKRKVKHRCDPLYSPVVKIQYVGDYRAVLEGIRTTIYNISTPVTNPADLFFKLHAIEGTTAPTFLFSPLPWLYNHYPSLYCVEFNDFMIPCDFLLEDIKPFFRLWEKPYQVHSGASFIQSALTFHHFNKSSLVLNNIKRKQHTWLCSYD